MERVVGEQVMMMRWRVDRYLVVLCRVVGWKGKVCRVPYRVALLEMLNTTSPNMSTSSLMNTYRNHSHCLSSAQQSSSNNNLILLTFLNTISSWKVTNPYPLLPLTFSITTTTFSSLPNMEKISFSCSSLPRTPKITVPGMVTGVFMFQDMEGVGDREGMVQVFMTGWRWGRGTQ